MTVLALFLILVLSFADSSFSSAFFMLIIYCTGIGLTCTIPSEYRVYGKRIFHITFIIYVLLAFIVSRSFSVYDHFIVSDSSRYIESYINRHTFFYNKEDFIHCYFYFSDTNLLYNAYLNIVSMFANNELGGMTIFDMTLCQTIWGILSAIVLFRICLRHLKIEKAYKYTLSFTLCSLFLFYSTVIIRDISICFLYLIAFNVVDQKFKLSGVLKILIVIILAWGVRLYSGIFAGAFLAYYIYVKVHNTRQKYIVTFLFGLVLVLVASFIMTSSLVEQTTTELNEYEELSAERSAGGMLSKLQSLPSGISHFAIVLFSMIRPLPPLGIYEKVSSFSNFMMSTMNLVAGFFWFVVFYSLLYLLFVKKYLAKIPFEKVALLVVCLVFMLANASHPDLRRMLPVFPILFVQYVDICKVENETIFGSSISKILMTLYIVLAIALLPLT